MNITFENQSGLPIYLREWERANAGTNGELTVIEDSQSANIPLAPFQRFVWGYGSDSAAWDIHISEAGDDLKFVFLPPPDGVGGAQNIKKYKCVWIEVSGHE